MRVNIDAIDQILYQTYNVLDHGFIRVIDYMGNDAAITQAARVSYGRADVETNVNKDRHLIRYLLKHKHTSPFEMCEIKFHIKAPIFVARQWIRHRTANINELSARYSIVPSEYYIPDDTQILEQSSDNKQGRGEKLTPSKQQSTLNTLKSISESSYQAYQGLLEENGLAREIARTILPQNMYTEFYWKIDLHNLMHFIKLRIDHHAQYEIRVYATLILSIIEKWVPATFEAFNDYIRDRKQLSENDERIIGSLLDQQKVSNFIKDNQNSKSRETLDLIEFLQKIL